MFWILLVEDNPADASLVHKALEDHGIEGSLMVVSDGQTAIELIEDIDRQLMERPDMAIVDLNLPKKSGLEVLERMRRSAPWNAIPVVVLSSSDAEQDRNNAARLGASRYVRKPSKLEDFLKLGALFKTVLGLNAR